MADDWRVTATLREEGLVERLLDRLHRHDVEDEVVARLGGRVVVTTGPRTVFVYADGETAAREAERLLRGLDVTEVAVERWHAVEERWEDPSVTLSPSQEHQRRQEQETAESQRTNLAEWEVRLELETHREATDLADRLAGEGLEPVRRWKYLVVGANNEDEANELAKRLRREAPNAAVTVETGPAMAREGTAAGSAGTLFAAWFG
jgi:hypothetical protein